MEFWLEAGGFQQRCYVLATEMKSTDIRPSLDLSLASRLPTTSFKVRWPLVKFYNLTGNEFAMLVKSHVDWHVKLGVHQHIIYITEAVLSAASHPIIKVSISISAIQMSVSGFVKTDFVAQLTQAN